MGDVRVANQYLCLFTKQGDHLLGVLKFVVHFGMLEVHLFSAEETGCNGVMSVFKVLFLLVRGEEGPAKKAGTQFV
jgi:hypothetical protein